MLNSSSSNNGDRNTVQRGISQTQEYLTLFASSKDLSEKIGLVYGNELNSQALGELIDAWQVQNFSTLPSVEVSPQTNLGSAKAVYAIATNTIYLSQEFIGRNSTSPQNVTSVLLEEIGHFLDAKINRFDAKGDEGEIFSRIVQNIPTSDTQLSQLQAEDDRGTITLQDGAQVNVEQAGIYTGTNLKTELQNAIPDLLDKVKNFINTDMLQGLPLLGNQLGIANPLDALFNGFKTQILSRLAIAPDLDPVAEAKQALLDVLSGALNLLQDSNGDNLINIADIDAIEGTDSVTFKLKIGQNVKTSINLSEDIGLPALGLKLRGGVTPELGFNWSLEFGVDKTTGFFVNTGGAAPELSLSLKTQLVDSLGAALALDGNLGFLTLTAKDQGSLIQGDFSVDLQNPLATLSVIPKFAGNANLKLGLDASFGGSSKLPKIGTDLNLNWDFAAGTSDSKTAGIYAGGLPSVAFDKVRLDVGSFFKDFADPVFGTLNDVLGPIRPLLKVVSGRLPVIDDLGKSFLDQNADGKVSLIDIALRQNPDSATLGFINALLKVDAVTQSITDLSGDGSIPLIVGSFNLGNSDVRNAGFSLSTVDLGASSAIAKTADQILSELGGLEINGKQANSFTDLISAAGGGGGASTLPQFPILTDPNQVFKLLLGQDAEFFKYTLPELSFKDGFDEFFRLFGPFGVRFFGNFSARAQVAVGYDSTGIKQFVNDGANDPSKIFNGFYIDNAPDLNGPAGRKSGGEVKAIIGAGAGADVVLASATINGEVASNLNVLLNDPKPDNKVYFNEFDPNCIFMPVEGKITAGLNFSVKVGIGPFSVRKKFDIAKVTLLDFALGCTSDQKAQIAINGLLATSFPDRTLSLNIGTTAASRILNGIAGIDNDESFTVNYKSGTPDDATLIIGYSDVTKEYANVKRIVANGGNKGDAIAISDQVFTPAELTGGNEGADESGDQLFGGSGNDIIKGEGGNDSLYGGAGIDNLDGGTGDDLLNGGAGADILNGGDGFDTISYLDAKAGIKIFTNFGGLVGVQGDALGDQITNIEQIEGTNFFDAIQGDSLDNVIVGFDGDDNLEGGDGNDVLLGGLGGDRLAGGNGSDWTSYATSFAAVNINLETGKASNGEATGDVLISIENVGGSASGDILTGSAVSNFIDGFLGDDKIQGGGGADTLDGGEGNDTAIYQDSTTGVNVSLLTGIGTGGDAQGDILILNSRPDPNNPLLIITYNSIENLVGSNFNDTLTGDIGDNKLEGLAGNDILRGGDGNDILIGGAGADPLDGGLGVDTADYSSSQSAVSINFQAVGLQLQGSGGDAQGDTFAKTSVIFGDSTVENLIGSKFGDTLIADGGFNKISPGLSSGGIDLVDGGGNTDVLVVDYSVRDTGTGVTGGYNLGSVSGGQFLRLTSGGSILDAIVFANIEKLIVTGTFKDDVIYGGASDDRLFGGDGNDLIYGGFGSNQILAGNGNDTVVDQSDSSRTFNGFPGNNTFGIFLDGGRGIDTLSINLAAQISRDSVVFISLDPTVENLNQFLTLRDGTAIINFEIFKDINTSLGKDTLIQLGRVNNNFSTAFDNDIVNPGLGIDVVDGGNNDANFEDDLLILDYSIDDIGTGILAREFDLNNASYGGRFYRNTLAGNLLDQVTLSDFERFNITGTSKNDTIYGGFGNDILIGNAGNDLIIGNERNDVIEAGDGNDILIGANQFEVGGGDINQVDTLTGGTGADEFWLGDGTYVYYDDQNVFSTGRSNYALITDFQSSENDVIQLKGTRTNYSSQVVNGNTEISLIGFFFGSLTFELIGIVQGVTDFDLGATYVRYVNIPQNIVANSNNISVVRNAENFDLIENSDLTTSQLNPELTESLNLDPLVLSALSLSATITPDLPIAQNGSPIPTPLQISAVAPIALAVGDFSITQNGNGNDLLTQFLGDNTTGLSNFQVNLKGNSQAFGTFTNDPFGLGSGIVLSTGKVTDLAGSNTADGGFSPGINTKLKFTKLPGGINNSGVFVADVSNLGFDLKLLTFADSGSLFGGLNGKYSGFDLDAIRLSNQLVTKAADINLATAIDVFDFSPVGTIFTAGSQRIPFDIPYTELYGTVNGYINNGIANLAEFDKGIPGVDDSVSLGDNGRVSFNLTTPVSTSTQPLYLYVGESANNGETPDGLFSASNREVNSLSDLSTDFGVPGVADDTISMEVEFDADASTTNVYFQFVFGSEELLEYAGKFNDAFSLELNGVNLATLSNGNEVTINNLAINPVGPYSPDLIYNPVSTPTNLQSKLDGYTKVLTFIGDVTPNSVNKLVITVKDNRDGLLDSAVFLKAGSFSIAPPAASLTQIVDINIINGGNTFTFTGSPSGVEGQVLASDTSFTPIKTIFESELEGLPANTNVVLQANGNVSVGFIADNVIALQYPFSEGNQSSLNIAADFDNNGLGSFTVASPENDGIQALGRNINISGASVTSGNISTTPLYSFNSSTSFNSSSSFNLDRQLSSINLNAKSGDVSTGNLSTNLPVFGFINNDALIEGGAIAINATGNISTQNLDSAAANFVGNDYLFDGGAIALNATGNISTSDIISASLSGNFSAGDSGAIKINGSNVNINGRILSFTTGKTSFGKAAPITLSATTNIDIKAINTLGTDVFPASTDFSNISLTGNEINLAGGLNSIRGDGKNLILQSFSANQAIQIGSPDTGSASVLDITDTDLGAIAAGFNKITIGRSDSSGTIDINSGSFTSPVTFRTSNGQININTTLLGNLDFNASSVKINNGLTLGKSEEIIDTANLILNGGTFSLNGFNETANQLTISTNSAIDFGNGNSTLAFSASSSQTWTGLLTINNWSSASGETLKFGNDANALTPTQLSQIQFTGFNQGAQISSSGIVTPLRTKQDFNADAKSDIFWRDPSSGDNYIWNMNGPNILNAAQITSAPSNFSVQKTGDFNGDGKADIVWRDPASGTNAIWLMDNFGIASSALLPAAPSNYTLEAVGDFFGTGKSALLWRDRTSGFNAIWQIDGTNLVNSYAVTTAAPNFGVGGTGDFNGDGKTDILWRDPSSGYTAIWDMDGASIANSSQIYSAGTNFTQSKVGDFNNDGKADILWRDQSAGLNAIWLMNNFAIADASFITSTGSNFTLENVADYYGTGKSGILWRDRTSGFTAIWQMDGLNLVNGTQTFSPTPNFQVTGLS